MSDAYLWREAAEKAIKSLQDLNVYKLVPLSTVPSGQTSIGTMWVFKVKQIKRTRRAWFHKAGTTYLDKTAQHFRSSRQKSVRIVLAIAEEMDWEVRQLDVKTACLYAGIEEEVFVAEPPGFEMNDNEKDLLVKIGKASMGWLKALGSGFIPLIPFLSQSDILLSKSDACIYIYNHYEAHNLLWICLEISLTMWTEAVSISASRYRNTLSRQQRSRRCFLCSRDDDVTL